MDNSRIQRVFYPCIHDQSRLLSTDLPDHEAGAHAPLEDQINGAAQIDVHEITVHLAAGGGITFIIKSSKNFGAF